jgi:hypothetical protein
MALTDRIITCRICEQTFAWTIGQQAYYAQQSLVEPQLCATCASRRRQRVTVPVTRERVLRWLREEHLVPACVSSVHPVGRDGRFRVTLQECDGPRAVELPLIPEEALVAAIWLEPDPDLPTAPAASHGGAPSSPCGLAVCLEAVWPMRPAMRPRGYRLVLLMPGGQSGRRLSTLGALGWILQDHTPLLVDEWLFALQLDGAWPWPPRPGTALHDFLATLEALDVL